MPLTDLIARQDQEFEKIDKTARRYIEKLYVYDRDIRTSATTYFKAAREAEIEVQRYQRIKYDAELSYLARK